MSDLALEAAALALHRGFARWNKPRDEYGTAVAAKLVRENRRSGIAQAVSVPVKRERGGLFSHCPAARELSRKPLPWRRTVDLRAAKARGIWPRVYARADS